MKKNRGMGALAVAAPGQAAWFLAACRDERGRSGPVAGAGRRAALTAGHSGGVAAGHDPQAYPGRGGVLGRIPGEPAAAAAAAAARPAAAGAFSVAFLSIDSILETLMTSTSRARPQAASAASAP